MNQERILDISWGTILKIFIAVLCIYIIYQVHEILVWFIFALIISILLNPAIEFFQKRKIPRSLSVILIYAGIFGMFGFLVYSFTPIFVYEIEQFLQVLPQYFERISPYLKGLGLEAIGDVEDVIHVFGKTLEEIAANVLNALFAIFGGLFATLFIVTVAVFLSLEERVVERTLSLLFPKRYEAYILDLWERCQRKIAGWFGTRILACLFVGILCYITFLLFNVEYPFALAVLAGILNFIPIIGPIIAGSLIFLLVALDSISQAIFVLIIFILIQQLENNILTPILTRRFVGLSPALVLTALAIGGILWGVLGAILAVPLFGILFEFFKEFLQRRKKEEKAVIL